MASHDHDENNKKVSSGGGGLQGQRPPPLRIGKSSSKIKKKKQQPRERAAAGNISMRGPVIIYIRSPEVIHVEACNFKELVQQLTGNSPPVPSSSNPKANDAVGCNPNFEVVGEGRDQEAAAAAGIVAREADGGGLMQLQHDADDYEGEGYDQRTNWRMTDGGMLPASMANVNYISPSASASPGTFMISPNVYANLYDFGMISYSQDFHDDDTVSTYPRFNP